MNPDRSIRGSDHAPSPLEALEPRLLFTAVPLITEFLASNDTVLDDEDGDSSDWIEIYNAGDTALDLDGWHLTDDADDLTQWTFPDVSLEPGQYLVVFASNKDRADADGTELHTNFALSAGGEYIALVEQDGTTVAHAYMPEYPAQTTDISYGLAQSATQTPLIAEGADARYIVPSAPIVGWNTLGFNDTSWAQGPTGIGHEQTGTDYAGHLETILPDNTASVYLRQSFSVADPNALTSLTLGLRYDDGFLAYLNGTLVAADNAPSNPQYNSTATAGHGDALAVEFQPFDLTAFRNELVAGNNVLAIQAMNRTTGNSDMLIEATLTATQDTGGAPGAAGYMTQPTPGAVNIITGPLIASVTENPPAPGANQNLIIEAEVADNAGNGIDRVDLHYRINFNGELTLQMFDNGVGNDALAGDGIYTATISSGLYAAGDMVRWYVTAEDDQGTASRAPLIVDDTGQDQDPEYFGTVVVDPSITSNLPVFQWFVQDPNAAETTGGTRASVYFDGRFYDDVFVRRRGNSSASLNKKSFKIEFNKGHDFVWEAGQAGVNEINLNTTYTDKSYLRQQLGFEVYDLAGAYGSESRLWRVEQNGDFFSVAAFIEQVDEDMLEREGLDPDGALYKMFNAFTSGTSGVEKKTRLHENNNDLSDFVGSINGLSGQALTDYIFDHVDIPATLNYLAATALIQHSDSMKKNYYLYRDTEGTGEWTFIPWDLDLSFGRHFMGGGLTGDTIWADKDNFTVSGTVISPSHPLVGEEEHYGNRSFNNLIDALYESPEFVELYLRRLRTLMDEILGAPGTPAQNLVLENRIAEIQTQIGNDAVLDVNEWGQYGQSQTLQQAIDILVDDFLAVHRQHYFVSHSVNNPGFPDNAGIPNAQTANPVVSIGAIDFNPAGGNQDQEYIEIVNSSAFAIDISGWTVEGAITHTFRPGTVVGAGASLYITPDSSAFRARAAGPSGGQGLQVQQWDDGHLSSFGETITLKRGNGTTAATKIYTGNPSLAQQFLRITELHYNPAGPTPAEQSAGFTDGDQFEFIELQNTSPTQTLNLNNVHFDTNNGGVAFDFGSGTTLSPGQYGVLVSNLAAFQERYGTGINILGIYTGNLANSGEQVKLEDATNSTIAQFAYEDGTGPGEADWPTSPDGDGPSLVVNDTEADYSDGNNWRASLTNHGTPGSDEAAGVLGDITGDGFVGTEDLDALLALWGDAAASSPQAAAADLDNSGTVGSGDLNIVINNFGNGTTPNNPTSNGDVADDNDTPGTPGNPGSSADADAGNNNNAGNDGGAPGNNSGAGNETPFPSQRPRPDQPTPQRQPEPATPPATPPATRQANANAADRPNTNTDIHANANTPLTPAQQQAANAQRTPSALDLVKPKTPTATDTTTTPATQASPLTATATITKPRFDAMMLR
ncbi:lamin tail domain-containing protein [Phycisphaeraceae bacterium D3-23]